MKTKILMLAPHDATIDPRVIWEASFAAKNHHVTLLGLKTPSSNAPNIEQKNGYEIRNKRELDSPLKRLIFLFYALSVATPLQKVFLVALYLVSAPFLLIIKIYFKLSKYILKRNVLNGYSSDTPGKKIPFPTQVKLDIQSLLWFVDFISNITSTFLQEISQLPNKPDIIHCNDIFSLLTGLLAKKRTPCKVVYDAHEYICGSDSRAGPLQKFVLKLFEGFLIKKADQVVTVTPLLANLFEKDYKLAKVFSLPNASPITLRQPYSGELAQLAKGRVKFLYQGNFAPCRGIEEIIKAWEGVNTTQGALFLMGPESVYRDKYIALAKELGLLDSSVYFPKAVPQSLVITVSSQADVGLIPYNSQLMVHAFCCPNKLSEYMQAGLMIISNQSLLYVNQILKEGNCGTFYDSSSISSITQSMQKAIQSKDLRELYKKKSLAYSKSHYNWEKLFPVLEEIYSGQNG